MDWPGQRGRVGELSVFEEGGREHYQFVYAKEWPRHFPIGPSLSVIPGLPYHSSDLWGAFQDISLLYIAKFQSRFSTARTSSWEATLLDMAKSAGLTVAKHRLLNAKSERPILLVEGFDRDESGRVPFLSAMTLMQLQSQVWVDAKLIKMHSGNLRVRHSTGKKTA
jgi:hypothetical protein